ncbi:HTH domain-containing protein [Pseudomonas fluorescens]|uniref:HTH domain-containing protein n=1 Tax=Pseudomonas fluorescens TaxID=294 RepID=UPI00058A66FE|nr:HTH domain-containing protein [Pseudomonas fluorescens]CEL31181.1 putative DNA-binding protein [Pseudomonas fluorescens]
MRKAELKINASKSTKAVLKRTPEEDAMITTSYENGMGITEIANQHGVSRQVMLSRIKVLGIWSRKSKPVDSQIVIDLCMNGKSLPEIIKLTGSTEYIVRSILKAEKLKCERSKTVFKNILIPKDTLFDLYINQNMTAKQIAEIYKCKTIKVTKHLSDFGIKRPVGINITKNELQSLYIKQNMTLEAISGMLGVGQSKVYAKLKKYGIKKKIKTKFSITEAELRNLYVTQDLTRKEIAQKFNVSTSVIQNRIKKYEIHKLLELEQLK